jgi:hypothetical protein
MKIYFQIEMACEGLPNPPLDLAIQLERLRSTAYISMDCRIGCGVCCIAPSISSPILGMPEGKPSGVRCVQLTGDNRCLLFGLPERPEVCVRLRPTPEMCRENAEQALIYLYALEYITMPESFD